MRLDEFASKWAKANLKERSAAQEHTTLLANLLALNLAREPAEAGGAPWSSKP